MSETLLPMIEQIEPIVRRLRNLTAGHIAQPPGATVAAAVGKHRLIIVQSGVVTVRVAESRIVAPRATMFVIPAVCDGTLGFLSSEETRYTWLHFAFEPEVDDSPLLAHMTATAPLPLSAAMAVLANRAVDLHQSRLPTAFNLRQALGMEILWRLVGEVELLATGAALSSPVEAARRFVQGRLATALTLREIAREANVSSSHLTKLFASELGTSPMSYVWQQRVNNGLQLLEESRLPVGAIALQCGFKTQFHFSRRVRDATGLAPSEVRRLAWGESR
jgi:AraC family transcriptional regulator of arabinose operon